MAFCAIGLGVKLGQILLVFQVVPDVFFWGVTRSQRGSMTNKC